MASMRPMKKRPLILALSVASSLAGLSACSRETSDTIVVTSDRPKDAGVKRDTRPPGTGGGSGENGSGGASGSGGAPASTPDVGMTPSDGSAEETGVSDASAADAPAGDVLIASDAAPDVGPVTPPAAEAMWSHTMCNKRTLPFPKIDKNNGVFPVGSCPPPENLNRACGGNSKIKVMRAIAQSYETGYWHPPEYAIDEHLMTRWSSNTMPTSWLQLDLGTEQSFKRIYLAWELAYATDYDIVTSNNGTTWTMLKQVRGGDGYQDIVDVEGKARYVRINGVRRGVIPGEGPYGYSLFDLTICGERP
jgi:F5/8 type C domain